MEIIAWEQHGYTDSYRDSCLRQCIPGDICRTLGVLEKGSRVKIRLGNTEPKELLYPPLLGYELSKSLIY
jgi:hypothetical protein